MERGFRRDGFTLIELLVVLTIIGVLLALIIPAVQKSREAARKAACANRLHNIGVALNHHASTFGVYPAGYGLPHGVSYLLKLLPFVERQALYDTFNFALPPGFLAGSSENGTTMFTRIDEFTCPSDGYRTAPLAVFSANYAANAGENSLTGTGAFINRPLPPAEIRDGLSGTVGVSEWVVGEGNETHQTRLGSTYSITDNTRSFDRFRDICRALDPHYYIPSGDGYKGRYWIDGGLGTTQYNHVLTPNMPSCYSWHFKAVCAGSYHGGGCYSLWLDGRVGFVQESINQRLWTSLGTRSGGEVAAGEL
jgi:prepilin-type N-terminal cleavage/methylation domain-containing protein